MNHSNTRSTSFKPRTLRDAASRYCTSTPSQRRPKQYLWSHRALYTRCRILIKSRYGQMSKQRVATAGRCLQYIVLECIMLYVLQYVTLYKTARRPLLHGGQARHAQRLVGQGVRLLRCSYYIIGRLRYVILCYIIVEYIIVCYVISKYYSCIYIYIYIYMHVYICICMYVLYSHVTRTQPTPDSRIRNSRG